MKNETKIRVPKKYHKMIKEIYHDSDGYWVHTERGYRSGMDLELHTIHEDTVKEILEQIKDIQICDCNYCKGLED